MSQPYRIRGGGRFLSEEVDRFLRIIAKGTRGDTEAFVTPDQIADNLLRKAISEEYPQLIELQGEIETVEKKMVKTIQGRTP